MTSEDHYLSPDKAYVTMAYIGIFNFLISFLPFGVFFAGQVIPSLFLTLSVKDPQLAELSCRCVKLIFTSVKCTMML